MKFLSLFSGIGGFDLGLERAGMQCVGQVEIEPFCQAVLKKHWPNVKRMEDIKNVTGYEFGSVDLICGGVPCQPASSAGKRAGTADDRWLWPDTFRIVRAIKPTWCLFENVRGLTSLEQGVVFDNLLSELESYEYEVQTFCIPACAVNAPHRRDRVWIIAHSKSKRSGGEQGKICGEERGQVDGLLSDTVNADKNVDYSERPGCQGKPREVAAKQNSNGKDNGLPKQADCDASNTGNTGLQRSERAGAHDEGQATHRSITECNHTWDEPWTEVATRLCRMDDGVSNRAHRLKALGNAVVPQIVEEIGWAIIRAAIVAAEPP